MTGMTAVSKLGPRPPRQSWAPCFHFSLLPFWLGWLPYGLRPVCLLSRAMLAPSVMSTRGGAAKPNPRATLTRSSLCTSKTLRSECAAYACRYER